jgi:hypothetical protein
MWRKRRRRWAFFPEQSNANGDWHGLGLTASWLVQSLTAKGVHVLEAASEGTILAGQRGPLRQGSMAVGGSLRKTAGAEGEDASPSSSSMGQYRERCQGNLRIPEQVVH